jgi:FAD/FMN-containing dehydrogenase
MEKVSTNMVSNFINRVPSLFSDLANILAGDIDCSQGTLATYSTDDSPYIVFPQAVIFPKNATDIKHVLSFAREYTMPVSIRGGGSGGSGGALSEGIILDMQRYFNQIRNVNMMEHTVTVDAGTTLEALLEKLHAWKFDIPLCIGLDPHATIGGLIATKSSSGSSFHHGTIREWIEGMTVVVDNGEEHHLADGITPSGRLLGIYQDVFPLLMKEGPILRASKPKSHDDATGYNIWNTSIGPRQLLDQLTGSEGTLGIITSVTLRISPRNEHVHTTCVPVTKKDLLATYVEIAKHHKAEHIFMYDETFMQLSERYHPTLVPFFKNTPYVLLITHTEHDIKKLHDTVRTFHRSLPQEKTPLVTFDDRKKLERITSADFLFSLFSLYTKGTQLPIPLANGLIVSNHVLNPFLEHIEDYLDSLGKLYTITGNVGGGAVSVHTLFDPLSKEYDNDMLAYGKNIFAILESYEGGMSATGGDGLMRTPFLSYVYNDQALAIFKKIKNIWDPVNVLNPGKKISVSTNYLKQHQKRIGS